MEWSSWAQSDNTEGVLNYAKPSTKRSCKNRVEKLVEMQE